MNKTKIELRLHKVKEHISTTTPIGCWFKYPYLLTGVSLLVRWGKFYKEFSIGNAMTYKRMAESMVEMPNERV